MGRYIGLILGGIALAGCSQEVAEPVAAAVPIEVPCVVAQPAPYADGIPYADVHGNARNDDVIACETHTAFVQSWQALEGMASTQPNSFSPDGTTTYLTVVGQAAVDRGCNLYALNVQDGSVRWCRAFSRSVVASAVVVDAEGYLYIPVDNQLVSLTAAGEERWRSVPVVEGGIEVENDRLVGMHFTPDGHIATVTSSGVILLLRRADGVVLSQFSISEQLGFVSLVTEPLEVDLYNALPAVVQTKIQDLLGVSAAEVEEKSGEVLSAFLGGGGAFVSHTLAVGPGGALYVVGGGLEEANGAVLRINVTGPVTAPVMAPAWYVPIQGGGGTSVSVSADGHHINFGDGVGLQSIFGTGTRARVVTVDVAACNQTLSGVTEVHDLACDAYRYFELEQGAIAGSVPLDADGVTYVWESGLLSYAFDNKTDLHAHNNAGKQWEIELPDGLTWSSTITVSRNHLVGTASRILRGEERVFGLPFPGEVEDYLLVLDRANGDVLVQEPITEDATNSVTIGPDGSLYVPMLGVLNLLATEVTRTTLGLVRFQPRALD